MNYCFNIAQAYSQHFRNVTITAVQVLLYFNSSKALNTEFKYRDTDDVVQVMADTEGYAETRTIKMIKWPLYSPLFDNPTVNLPCLALINNAFEGCYYWYQVYVSEFLGYHLATCMDTYR